MPYTSDRTGANIDKILDINDGYETTTALIASSNSGVSVGDVFKAQGYATAGDGGRAEWRYTGNTVAASQTPAQLVDSKCSDALGNEFELVSDLTLEALGGDKPAFNAAAEQVLSVAPRDTDKTVAAYSITEYGDISIDFGKYAYLNHVEANLLDDPAINVQRDFVAYSFRLTTNHTNSEGGDVRGIKGNCIGNGGAANIRGAHFLASGDNGHTGDLTGVLAVVDHADGTSEEAGSIGKGIGVIASLGAKCTSGFEARSYVDNQVPSFGYRIATGAAAIRPESACYLAHGGGNGAMFKGFESDSDSTVTYEVTNKGHTKSGAYQSDDQTVADDAFIQITPPATSGMIEVFCETTSQAFGKCYFRTTGTPLATEAYSGTITDFTTGVLTGTTGTNGNLTISADSTSGDIFIENRTNASRSIVWMFTANTSYK